jgi:hypothetical protein
MNIERLAQIQNLKNGGVYATNGDKNFDMVIEHNDSDFGENSSEEEESMTKDSVDTIAIKHQLSINDRKIDKIDEKINRPNVCPKSIERPVRVPYFDPNADSGLLKHWENKYGGKEHRKYYTDLEKFKNNWDSEEEGKEIVKLIKSTDMRKIQSTKPKKNDFEYDWDEDHQHNQNYESKKHPSDINTRVPLGGLPYSDTNYNNGYTDSSLRRELAKAGKNILGQIGT